MLRFKSGLQKWTLRSDPRRSGLRDPPVPRAVPAEDGGGVSRRVFSGGPRGGKPVGFGPPVGRFNGFEYGQ